MTPATRLEGLEPLRSGRLRFFIPGAIVAWARAGRGHGRTFTATPQRNFGAMVRDLAALGMGGLPLLEGPIGLRVVATYSWPASASKRRKAIAETYWKATAPDIDNVAVKLVADALEGVVYRNDGQIAELVAFKLLGVRPGLDVTVTPLKDFLPGERL